MLSLFDSVYHIKVAVIIMFVQKIVRYMHGQSASSGRRFVICNCNMRADGIALLLASVKKLMG